MQEDNYVPKTYFKVYDGRVCREWYSEDKVPTNLVNVKTRVTPQSHKTVWYKNYIFRGVLTGVYFKENDRLDEPQMEVNFEMNGEDVLTVKAGSSYHKSFLYAMQNFVKGEEVTFSPYNFTSRDTGKKVVGISFKDQAGEKIPSFYSKDDPKDLPPPVKKTKKKNGKNETTWNWEAQEDFLEAKFEEWLAEFITTAPEQQGVTEDNSSDAPDDVNDDGDVPF